MSSAARLVLRASIRPRRQTWWAAQRPAALGGALRHSSSSGSSGEVPSAVLSAASSTPPPGVAEAATAAGEALGWSPSHLVMYTIETIHQTGGIPYWEAIVAFTIAFRLSVLPLGIWTAQGSARMAAVRPHIQRLSDEQKLNANQDSRSRQKFALESKALMTQFKVNPLASLLMPLVQFPIFMSCYFGLQHMGELFPGFQTGGIYWFTNLSAADPYMILPLANAASFLIMIELGADGLQSNDQDTFKWIMRGLAVALTPLTMHMPQGLFIYWGVNNTFSIAQAAVLKNPGVRKYLDIPKPPPQSASAPGLKLNKLNPFTFFMDVLKKERETDERAAAEIVDGISASSTLSAVGKNKAVASAIAPGNAKPPPVVFATRPPRKVAPRKPSL